MNKENVIHTHTHTHTHWNIIQPKKNETLQSVRRWMDLEGIMPNKISQRQISYISHIGESLKKLKIPSS